MRSGVGVIIAFVEYCSLLSLLAFYLVV